MKNIGYIDVTAALTFCYLMANTYMLLCAAYIRPFSYMNHIHASAVISDRQITPRKRM